MWAAAGRVSEPADIIFDAIGFDKTLGILYIEWLQMKTSDTKLAPMLPAAPGQLFLDIFFALGLYFSTGALLKQTFDEDDNVQSGVHLFPVAADMSSSTLNRYASNI